MSFSRAAKQTQARGRRRSERNCKHDAPLSARVVLAPCVATLHHEMTALPSALRHWAFQERLAWGSSAAVLAALLYIFYGERVAPAPAPRRVSVRAAAAHDGDAVAAAAPLALAPAAGAAQKPSAAAAAAPALR